MQKISTVFERDENWRVIDRVNPECQWVLDGEGVCTVKIDGTACLVRDRKLYKRQRVKEGGAPPAGWLHWSMDIVRINGHGWSPITLHPSDEWHREPMTPAADGTYELVGPKIQRNPYGIERHELWRHGYVKPCDNPRTFEEIEAWLNEHHHEGLVWHHPDGRMAKIKRRDFGIPWPVK